MNNILNYLANNVPWIALGQIFGAGLGLSVSALILKFWKNLSKGSRQWLIYIGGVLIAATHYLQTVPSQVPLIVFVQGALIAFATQPWWRIMVKPLFMWVCELIAKNSGVIKEVETALEPVANPIVETTPVIEVAPVTPVADTDISFN